MYSYIANKTATIYHDPRAAIRALEAGPPGGRIYDREGFVLRYLMGDTRAQRDNSRLHAERGDHEQAERSGPHKWDRNGRPNRRAA